MVQSSKEAYALQLLRVPQTKCVSQAAKSLQQNSQSLNKIPLQRCSSIKLHKLFTAFSVKHVQRKPLFMVELGSTFVNALQQIYICFFSVKISKYLGLCLFI